MEVEKCDIVLLSVLALFCNRNEARTTNSVIIEMLCHKLQHPLECR